ncbi:MAG: crosslink repair DNA glycosylase YcaQ family protein, partial [Vicinamibacterales bacterium]
LLGEADLRDLLDAAAIDDVERYLQRLEPGHQARTPDGLHDLLLSLGDLSDRELADRSTLADTRAAVDALVRDARLARVRIAGQARVIAVEDAARYRDALGVTLPGAVPAALLEPVGDPFGDLIRRYARTHGPFTPDDAATRFGQPVEAVAEVLTTLTARGRLVEGAFRPGRRGREWCDPDVLRSLRRRSLAAIRHQIEPVDHAALARFSIQWQGATGEAAGADALLHAVTQLQGAPIQASVLERDVLPARAAGYTPAMLDALLASGEVAWAGLEPKYRDGILALYRTEDLPLLAADRSGVALPPDEARVVDVLRARGASFFQAIHAELGGGFPQALVATLWSLVWKGVVTNDTFQALRAWVETRETRAAKRRGHGPDTPRRAVPPGGEGRWSLVVTPGARLGSLAPTATSRATALAKQLLTRHGVVMRETMALEQVDGGFSTVYQVLTAMEAAGQVRRGYFVRGTGGAQFATPEAVEMLRAHRDPPEQARTVLLSTTDPASPYGAIAPWPADPEHPLDGPGGRGPTRVAGASVILVDGEAAGYLKRGDRDLLLFPVADATRRAVLTREVARALLRLSASREPGRRGLLISTINAGPALDHEARAAFVAEGFIAGAMGLQAKPPRD